MSSEVEKNEIFTKVPKDAQKLKDQDLVEKKIDYEKNSEKVFFKGIKNSEF